MTVNNLDELRSLNGVDGTITGTYRNTIVRIEERQGCSGGDKRYGITIGATRGREVFSTIDAAVDHLVEKSLQGKLGRFWVD